MGLARTTFWVEAMKILDSEVDLRANKGLLFRQHRVLFVLLIITAIMDAYSTQLFMQRIGPHVETNIVVRLLSFSYGTLAGPYLGKFYQICAVWIISVFTPRLTRFVCVMVILMNCYAFVVNMTVI